MRRLIPILLVGASLAACAAPQPEFQASRKSAVELRAIQARLVPGDGDTVMRGVVETLHDLGYRITRVDAASGTVSATRQTALRMAVVVQPRTPRESVVRANATIVALQEAQVDSPEFYERNFFAQLGSTMQRQLAALPEDVAAPEAVRPTAEVNSASAREAAARQAAPAATPVTGATTR